jgi:outer membrane protein
MPAPVVTLAALVGGLVLAGGFALGQKMIAPGEKLDLAKCIQIALDYFPAIQSARATAEAERNVVREAESAYYPQVGWSSSLGRSYFGSRTSSGITRAAGTYSSYSTGLSLSQNIFDFGKTPIQVRIQRLNYSASLADVQTAIQQTVFAVKQDYYAVLQAVRNRDVSAEAVKQYQLHHDQAQAQFDVGLAPKYDVTKSAVDLGNARLNLIKAQNAIKLALSTLNNAMGVTGGLDYSVEDNLSFEAYGLSFDEALEEAYANRPELASMAAKRQAAERSINLAKTGFYPTLSGTASYDYTGNSFPLAKGWSLALNLNVSLFNGFMTTAQVAQARANLNVLRAYLGLKQAEELVPVAQLNVTAAQENLDIANGSYKEGVGDPIQVADASAALVSAKIAYIQALYDCKVGRASLELAMGLMK